jgi:hypothetical protein
MIYVLMKWMLIAFAFLIVFSYGVIAPSHPDVACTALYDPVCGEDGKTYSNSCYATLLSKVRVACEGECPCKPEIACSYYCDPEECPSGCKIINEKPIGSGCGDIVCKEDEEVRECVVDDDCTKKYTCYEGCECKDNKCVASGGNYIPKCGNGICEPGEANDPGGCGSDADVRCLGPPAREGSCPRDCEVKSDCPEGCRCVGDTVSCRVDDEVKEVGIKKTGEKVIIKIDGNEVDSEGDVEIRGGRVFVMGGDGEERQLKIMPDKASEIAIQRLGEKGFVVVLRESGNYLVEARKQARLFGLFPVEGEIELEIDGESGEIVNEKRPWWSFLARGI